MLVFVIKFKPPSVFAKAIFCIKLDYNISCTAFFLIKIFYENDCLHFQSISKPKSFACGTGVSGWSEGTNGRGILGISSPGSNYHPLPGDESAGVMGISGAGTGVYAAATAGTSLHAVKLNFGISAGSVGIFENQKTGLTSPVVRISGVSNQPALELENGYLKVSGSTRTVFQITTGTGSTVAGNQVRFTYPGMSTSDMLIVTHLYTGEYVGAVGVW